LLREEELKTAKREKEQHLRNRNAVMKKIEEQENILQNFINSRQNCVREMENEKLKYEKSLKDVQLSKAELSKKINEMKLKESIAMEKSKELLLNSSSTKAAWDGVSRIVLNVRLFFCFFFVMK
jgi:hypothetical protein